MAERSSGEIYFPGLRGIDGEELASTRHGSDIDARIPTMEAFSYMVAQS